jgi:hypothetical protein
MSRVDKAKSGILGIESCVGGSVGVRMRGLWSRGLITDWITTIFIGEDFSSIPARD